MLIKLKYISNDIIWREQYILQEESMKRSTANISVHSCNVHEKVFDWTSEKNTIPNRIAITQVLIKNFYHLACRQFFSCGSYIYLPLLTFQFRIHRDCWWMVYAVILCIRWVLNEILLTFRFSEIKHSMQWNEK